MTGVPSIVEVCCQPCPGGATMRTPYLPGARFLIVTVPSGPVRIVPSGFPNASIVTWPPTWPYRPPGSSSMTSNPSRPRSSGSSGALLMGKLSSKTRTVIWAVGSGCGWTTTVTDCWPGATGAPPMVYPASGTTETKYRPDGSTSIVVSDESPLAATGM